MKNIKHKITLLTISFALLQFTTCQKSSSKYKKIEPAHTEHVEGSELSKLTLTEKAVERLEILTAKIVEEAIVDGAGEKTQKVTPYASIIYDSHGHTWVYTNPQPLIYLRHEIKIDRIIGDKVYLKEGPPIGTVVAIQGVAELYGTESHVGH